MHHATMKLIHLWVIDRQTANPTDGGSECVNCTPPVSAGLESHGGRDLETSEAWARGQTPRVWGAQASVCFNHLISMGSSIVLEC